MTAGDRVEELIEDLESDDAQAKGSALATITERSFSETEAVRLTPHVIAALDCKNAWVRLQAPNALAALADTHAVAMRDAVADDLPELRDLLHEGDRTVRGPVAHLVGATASKEVVVELDDQFENEVDSVKEGIEAGLRAAVDIGLEHLRSTDVELDDPIPQSLIYLARSHPHWVIDHEQELFDLLDGPNGDIAGEMFVRLLRTDARVDLSMDLLTEAVTIEPDVEDDRFEAAVNALDAMVRSDTQSDSVARMTDRYLDWLTADADPVQRRGLRLLKPVAEHAPDLLTDDLDAITVLATDAEAVTMEPARALVRTYATAIADGPREYLTALLRSTGGQPGFTWLAETLDVLRYEIKNRYQSVETGDLGGALIAGLHRATEDGRTVPVFWPSFQPKVIVAGAIAVLLDGVSDGATTVLYTKGTSNHWGGKTEVREEYGRYGIEIPRAVGPDGTPLVMALDELLPHGYVYDGQRRLKGDTAGPATLVLVSTEEQLEVVAAAGPTLFNFHSRVTDEEEAVVDEVSSGGPDRLVCPIYSLYSKHEHGGNRVPEYGPPDLSGTSVLPDARAVRDILDEAVPGGVGDEDAIRMPLDGDAELRALARTREIQIEAVDAPALRDPLTEGYDAAMDLLDFGAEHGGWRSFSYLHRFERLPVPADRYDRWVLERRRRGERGQRSWTMQEFVDEFDEFVRSVEFLARSGTSDVHEQLKLILRTLEQRNPLYEELCDRIAAAVDARRSLAIFTPTPAWRLTLEQCLLDDQVVARSRLRAGDIQILGRDSIRAMEPCDELLIAGPQRRQHTGFLLHPAADTITMLTYDGRWGGMISRRLQRFVDRLNGVLQEAESTPIPYPEVIEPISIDDGETESEEDPIDGATVDSQMDAATTGGRSSHDQEALSLQERFAETLDDSRIDEYAYDTDRYDDYTHQEFEIETASGAVLHREAGGRVLIEVEEADQYGVETRYRWVAPAELSIGATVLVIEADFWNRLWDEWLDDQYADLEGGRVTDDLATWYETATAIMEEVQSRLGADRPDAPEVLDSIASQLKAAGIERGEDRVHDWFESVHAAGDPLDLARDPALTIGPGDVESIQLIGETFDRDALSDQEGARIDQSLRKIRGAHIHEGHEIRADVAATLTDGGPAADEILAHATRYEVTAVTDVTDVED